MSYVGNNPVNQNFVAGSDQFNGTGSQTVFTLSRNVNTVNDIQVVVSNVPQDPFTAYSVAGNSLTFTSAPPAGTGNVYVVYRATNVQTFLASPRSVGPSQLSATGTPSSGTFLRGDNSWAAAGAQNDIFYENAQIITQDYTIAGNRNAMSSGPIEIAVGVTVTESVGANWVIV
jgi:hypothetical protein